MKKITKKIILENCPNPELVKIVCKQIGGRFWEILENCDLYLLNNNKTKGFIYEEDMIKFFKKNCIVILSILKTHKINIGAFDNVPVLLSKYSLIIAMRDISIAKHYFISKGYK